MTQPRVVWLEPPEAWLLCPVCAALIRCDQECPVCARKDECPQGKSMHLQRGKRRPEQIPPKPRAVARNPKPAPPPVVPVAIAPGSTMRQAVLEAVRVQGGPTGTVVVAAILKAAGLEVSRDHVGHQFQALATQGKLKRVGYGRYVVTPEEGKS